MDNIEIVRGAYAAFGRGDVAAVLGMMDAEIEWYAPDEMPEGGTFRGHDAVGGFFASLPDLYEELRVEPDRFLADGDVVIALGHHRGRIDGQAFEAGFAHCWTLRDGRAVGFREYMDTGKVLPLFSRTPSAVR